MASTHSSDAWNGEMGEKWARSAELMDRMLSPVGEFLLQNAPLSGAGRVLDIGCGAGVTTLATAQQLGQGGGHATGLDVSGPLLQVARQRASDQGVANVAFTQADSQSWTPEAPFDCAISRFGVMFFDDMTKAFANIRSMMRPGGEALFLVWREPAQAEIISMPMKVIRPFLKETPPKPDPSEPGPFRLAEPGAASKLLQDSGWNSVSVTSVDLTLRLSLEDARELFDRTPLPAMIEEQALNEAEVRQAYDQELESRLDADGCVNLAAGIWNLSAKA